MNNESNKRKIEKEIKVTSSKHIWLLLLILCVICIGVYYFTTESKYNKMYILSTDFKEDEYGPGFDCVVNLNSDTDWSIDMGSDGNNPIIRINKIDCENAKVYYETENRMDRVREYIKYESRVSRKGFVITNKYGEVDNFMKRTAIYGPTIGYMALDVGIEDDIQAGD